MTGRRQWRDRDADFDRRDREKARTRTKSYVEGKHGLRWSRIESISSGRTTYTVCKGSQRDFVEYAIQFTEWQDREHRVRMLLRVRRMVIDEHAKRAPQTIAPGWWPGPGYPPPN